VTVNCEVSSWRLKYLQYIHDVKKITMPIAHGKSNFKVLFSCDLLESCTASFLWSDVMNIEVLLHILH